LNKTLQAGLRVRGLCLTATLLALGGCAPKQTTVPPLTPIPSGSEHVGQFVWYDLLTNDVEGAKRFYGGLLGWTFDDGGETSPAYTTILLQGRPIGGIAATGEMEREVNVSQWVSNLSVADVDRAVEEVQRLGGTVVAEPQELPHRGRVAVVRDNQNALLALVRSATGDPPLDRTEVGGWLWTELWTRDESASLAFYEGLVGYESEAADDMTRAGYHVLQLEGQNMAGVLTYNIDVVEPNWLPYVLVEDPAPLVARVEELGGRVLFAPDPEVRGGGAAIVADPSGAALTLQKWPPEGRRP
jgi:predicted enzyme related to lactoylglutathione lyase